MKSTNFEPLKENLSRLYDIASLLRTKKIKARVPFEILYKINRVRVICNYAIHLAVMILKKL